MSIVERIKEDMKSAMRAQAREKLTTIRLLLAAVKQKEIDDRISLDDEAVINVIDKMIKQRRDSVNQFQSAQREDLVAQELAEIEFLSVYMPEPLTEDQIIKEINEVIAKIGVTKPQDIGKVIAPLKIKLAGRADMGFVSKMVKQALSESSK